MLCIQRFLFILNFFVNLLNINSLLIHVVLHVAWGVHLYVNSIQYSYILWQDWYAGHEPFFKCILYPNNHHLFKILYSISYVSNLPICIGQPCYIMNIAPLHAWFKSLHVLESIAPLIWKLNIQPSVEIIIIILVEFCNFVQWMFLDSTLTAHLPQMYNYFHGTDVNNWDIEPLYRPQMLERLPRAM